MFKMILGFLFYAGLGFLAFCFICAIILIFIVSKTAKWKRIDEDIYDE